MVAFLRQRGQVIASPALFGEITNIFKAALGQYCSTRNIPWIEFTKGQDKDKLVETCSHRVQPVKSHYEQQIAAAITRPLAPALGRLDATLG